MGALRRYAPRQGRWAMSVYDSIPPPVKLTWSTAVQAWRLCPSNTSIASDFLRGPFGFLRACFAFQFRPLDFRSVPQSSGQARFSMWLVAPASNPIPTGSQKDQYSCIWKSMHRTRKKTKIQMFTLIRGPPHRKGHHIPLELLQLFSSIQTHPTPDSQTQ